LQIISSLINNSPVLKQELRSQIAFPGSLNHNLTELRSLNAIELQADKTSRGLLFRLYSEVIDILERSFAETRKRQNESGIKLTVSDLMTPARSFLEAILAETVTEIIAKMTLQEVGAIIVNRGERTRKGYLLIQRLSAVRAFADGLGGQRVQALPRQYFSDPIILKGDKTIWDTSFVKLSWDSLRR
jgi:Na+-transporting NADH:ubiquinone oxidoreductase subunit NqrB